MINGDASDFNTPSIFQTCKSSFSRVHIQLPFTVSVSPFPSLKRKGTNFIIILLLSIENIKGMEGIFERAKAINIRRVYIDSHGRNLKVISSNKKLLAKIKILNRTPILSTQCWHIRGISLEIDTQKYRIKLNRCKSRFRDYLVEESFYKSIIYYYFDNLPPRIY